MAAVWMHFESSRCARLTILILACGWSLTAMQVTPATGQDRRLTNTGTEKRDLRFRDENTLVYTEQIGPRQLALMSLNLETGATKRLHPDFTNNEFEVAFASSGEHYAFIQNMGNLNLQLVIRRTDTNEQFAFREGGFSGMRSPCFTSDSQRVLYAYAEQGRQHIWSCNLKCEDRRRVVDSTGINNWPCATASGQLIFASTRDGNYELYAARADGSGVRRLTEHPRQDIRPQVSVDGKRIVFTSSRNGNYDIYEMRLDGSGLTQVTHHHERDDFAAWHPDGHIAYVAERNGRFDIHLRSAR